MKTYMMRYFPYHVGSGGLVPRALSFRVDSDEAALMKAHTKADDFFRKGLYDGRFDLYRRKGRAFEHIGTEVGLEPGYDWPQITK